MDRATVLPIAGFVPIAIGAMAMNGFLGSRFGERIEGAPEDPFAGSASHLIFALIPLIIGMLLMVASEVSGRRLLAYWVGSIGVGLLMASPIIIPTIISGRPSSRPLMGWFVIATYAMVISACVRWGIDLWRSSNHGSPIAWGLLGLGFTIVVVTSGMTIGIWRGI